MQSTGQTTRHASQPVHMSSSSNASVFGSFFLAIRPRGIVGTVPERRNRAPDPIGHPPHPRFAATRRGALFSPARPRRTPCHFAPQSLSCPRPRGSMGACRMDWLKWLIDVMLHLDRYLNQWAGMMGGWLYALLFAVIFAETGLVVTPFLPGDSLLFAVGALAATEGSPINVWLVGILMTVAAILGDAVNYSIGKYVGPKVFSRESSRLLNKEHLLRAHKFYERHG